MMASLICKAFEARVRCLSVGGTGAYSMNFQVRGGSFSAVGSVRGPVK